MENKNGDGDRDGDKPYQENEKLPCSRWTEKKHSKKQQRKRRLDLIKLLVMSDWQGGGDQEDQNK